MAALTVLTVYLAGVTWLALRPIEVLWVAPANLEPFTTIRADLARGPQEASRTIAAGVLRLAPLGVLLPLLGRRLGGSRFGSLLRTVFGGGMISFVLEFFQSMVPSRVADVDAVILNTVGIALIHLLCYGRLRALAFTEPRSSEPRTEVGDQAPPPEPDSERVRQARRSWAVIGTDQRQPSALWSGG